VWVQLSHPLAALPKPSPKIRARILPGEVGRQIRIQRSGAPTNLNPESPQRCNAQRMCIIRKQLQRKEKRENKTTVTDEQRVSGHRAQNTLIERR
jgi:hypothetical protein